MENNLAIMKPSPEYKLALEQFRQDMYQFYLSISHEVTPEYDTDGTQIVKPKPGTDFKYIIAAYMEKKMHQYFPGWSKEMASPLEISTEWVTAQVHIVFIDWGLYSRGIPIEYCKRKFYGVDSARVQYLNCKCKYSNVNPQTNKATPMRSCEICHGSGQLPHTVDNLVDLGDNCGSAVTAATKRAIREATGIGDDIYGKRLDFNEEVEATAITTE